MLEVAHRSTARRRLLADTVVRYGAVSVACALMNNGLLIALSLGGVRPLAAALAVFAPMCLFGYALQALFVFKNPFSGAEFTRYCLSMLSNQPIWFAFLFLFCDLLACNIAIAAPLSTVALFGWNYWVTRWVFRHRG